MKFYLVKNCPASFSSSWTDTSIYTDRFNPIFFRKLTVPLDVIPINEKLLEVEKCALIKEHLEKKISAEQIELLSRGELQDVFVSVGVSSGTLNSDFNSGSLNLSGVPNSSYALPKLINGLDGVTFKVDVNVVENELNNAPTLFTVSTPEMLRNGWNDFQARDVLFPVAHFPNWINFTEKLRARVTITVTIPDAIFCERFGRIDVPVHFDKEVLSDVTILGSDGIQVKANRCFLAAHSSVFLAMFQDDMKEGKESILEFLEMGANSIRAFLKYLYYDDTWDAEDPQVAMDLLKIAEKYGVGWEEKMKELISDKKSTTEKKPKIEEVPVNRKILEEAVLSDVTIVCGDGAEIKANRCFLAARSSVFLAMFQTDMAESRTSTLEMPDMEGKSVQAFLKYLYYDDIQDAKDDLQVAFDLLHAGHMYDIGCLEGTLRKMVLRQRNTWFDVDGATKLFMFARNMSPADEDLKKVAIRVLAEYRNNLEESGILQELLRTDHKAAVELMKCAFEHFPS